MTAAAIATALPKDRVQITLIESESIGIVGVGEATLPHLRRFNENLGIDEAEFMAATSATFKLGIEFRDWRRPGDAYIHPFGDYGNPVNGVGFHHYWRRLAHESPLGDISDFSLPIVAGLAGRFAHPASTPDTLAGTYGYAYQMDATRYAPFLRRLAESRGVVRHEGRVVSVDQAPESGDITAVTMEDGQRHAGDFFIDCSGFFGLLIEKTLGAGYEDWRHWLPCDRAVAVPTTRAETARPYTQASAKTAGWQWRIPLQHRDGNGYVFCSECLSTDGATAALQETLAGDPLAEVRELRFTTGMRKRQWHHNCVAIGLAGGFLEPLESTSIYLIQAAIEHLITRFPLDGDYAPERDDFNKTMQQEFERVRDFLILHYVATERTDSAFWRHIQSVQIPDSLAERIALFRERGVFDEYQQGLFLTPSWLAVFLGQGILPMSYDPRVDQIEEAVLRQRLLELRRRVADHAGTMQVHNDYLADYCPANL